MSATTFPVGTVLRVRAWVRDADESPRKTGYRNAVVVGDYMDRPVLWFYAQGSPDSGTTVQPLYRDMEYAETGRTVWDLSAATLNGVVNGSYRMTLESGAFGALFAELQSKALRARSAARRIAAQAVEA